MSSLLDHPDGNPEEVIIASFSHNTSPNLVHGLVPSSRPLNDVASHACSQQVALLDTPLQSCLWLRRCQQRQRGKLFNPKVRHGNPGKGGYLPLVLNLQGHSTLIRPRQLVDVLPYLRLIVPVQESMVKLLFFLFILCHAPIGDIMASLIAPFTIAVPEEKLQRLKQKLALVDFPDETIDVEPWTQGVPLADVKRLSRHWETTFDWRAAEAKLNEFPQFTVPIEVNGFGAYSVHFVHQLSPVKNAIPLLFLHGWPGSFIEVSRILPELIKGGQDFPAFHVVAPSLIDFGFSSASKKRNFNIDQHAEAYHKLMVALGYDEYGE